jgi:uncharacterized membrane protein YfcA
MEINILFFIYVVPAIILYGIAKSGLGGSMTLISIPLMTVVMPLGQALAIVLPILILSDMVAVYRFRKNFDTETLKILIPGAAIGIFVGSITFMYFSESLLKFIIGLMGFLFAGHYFLFIKKNILTLKRSFFKGGVCSVVSGFTSFCVHAGGTPLSVYLLPLRMKKEVYVGTRVIFFTCINLIKLPFYINLSIVTLESIRQSLLLFPLAALGIGIGYQILKIIEENLFYNIIYILILFSSIKLILDYLI